MSSCILCVRTRIRSIATLDKFFHLFNFSFIIYKDEDNSNLTIVWLFVG